MHRIRRVLALLLMSILYMSAALGEGVQVRFSALESEYLSAGALRALNQVLAGLTLVLSQKDGSADIALFEGETEILRMQSQGERALLTAGGLTSEQPFAYIYEKAVPQAALQTAQALGQLLSAWETTGNATAELGDAGKPKTQTVYALTGEEWAAVWPEVCATVLPMLQNTVQDAAWLARTQSFLQGLTIEGKGTLRRYFAADGTEMGAYFYAAQVHFAENDVREVRLEYGYTQDKGFYLAFRCPNKKETRNLRISVKGKVSARNERTTYTLNADIRRAYDGAGDTYIAESSLRNENNVLTGEAALQITRKRKDGTVKTSLTAEPVLTLAQQPTGEVKITCTQDGQMLLSGMLTVENASYTIPAPPAVCATLSQTEERLSRTVLLLLQKADSADRMELVHYLAGENNLLEKEAELLLADFITREDP